MSTSPIEFLGHMRDETDYLLAARDGLSRSEFLRDETLKRAFVRSAEVIGEAAKSVPDDFRKQHPAVEWKALEAITDRLIHRCFGTDYEIIWDFVEHKVPELKEELEKLLEG